MIVAFPANIFPDTQQLIPVANQQVFEGPYNIAHGVINYGGERWGLNMAFDRLNGADRAEMMGFVSKLRISRNTFLIVNHTAPSLGALNGAPVVAVSSQIGSILILDAVGAPNQVDWAKEGDFLSVNCELKIVLNDVSTDVSAIASLSIWPPIRQPPASGTMVFVTSPVGIFRLVRPVNFETTPPGYHTSITMEAMEYISSATAVNL